MLNQNPGGRHTNRPQVAALFLSLTVLLSPAASAIVGPELVDAVLFNGQILTMDDAQTVVTMVRIQNDVITAVGNSIGDLGPLSADTRMIDLGERTVVPGMIDTHVHFSRDGQAPGYRIYGVETSFTIPDLLDVIAARTLTVPDGEFMTLIGGIRRKQFAENRFPTLAEMDGVAPNHPVYLQESFSGNAVTNTPGIAYFQGKGVTVNPNGTISGGSQGALDALVGDLTAADADRALREYITYAASMGLTGVIDFGGSLSSVPSPLVAIPFDVWQDGEMDIRFHKGHSALGPPDGMGVYPVIPAMAAALAQLDSFGGPDDHLDVDRVGEFVVFGGGLSTFITAFGQVADEGYALSQHSISGTENNTHIDAFEAVNAMTPLASMRWALDHVFSISTTNLARLAAIDVGIGAQAQQYFLSNSGPPYRDILNSGVKVGAGTDGTMICPLTPWAALYHMITGRDVTGALVNPGQTLTRLEALDMYTRGSSWFTFNDDKVGSIEVGKLADLVVVSDDFLTVPEIEIRSLRSVLTIVGGEIVYVDQSAFPSYGCGFNPPDSMVTISGAPQLGTTWTVGVDNPLGTQPAGAVAYLLLGWPDADFPCGTQFNNFGMTAPFSIGEMLIDLDIPYFLFGPTPWAGAGSPAAYPFALPNSPELIGLSAAMQGVIVDNSGVSGIFHGLTEGLVFTLE
jgi:predicted amidohydrolase YtcJ